MTLLVASLVTLVMVGVVVIAVYSPLLALRTITIEGASRVNVAAVHAAVDGQLGTPLALIDAKRITKELAAFPAIRSYVTETIPPHTLVIRIVERVPIGSVATPTGFQLVDAAGVVLSESTARDPASPLIELADGSKNGPGFRAAAAVIQALPSGLSAQVDTVTASTADDVTILLRAGQRVLWGSAERSQLKARVLAALLAQDAKNVVQYDVSAPDSAVITRG